MEKCLSNADTLQTYIDSLDEDGVRFASQDPYGGEGRSQEKQSPGDQPPDPGGDHDSPPA